MAIKVKKTNLRRLASLSALGAGALGVAASTADGGTPDAGGIVYSGIVDEKVGWAAGYGTRATIFGPNLALGIFGKRMLSGTLTTFAIRLHYVEAFGQGGSHGTQFRFRAGAHRTVSAFPRGARFGTPPASRSWSAGGLAVDGEVNGGSVRFTYFNGIKRYLLFRFTGGQLPQPMYGWAQLLVSLPAGLSGPNVTLVDYAYGTTGAQIPAGYRGKALDGDEGEYERSGLSALALGAAGVRSWRAARQAEASGVAGATPAH